MSGPAWPRWVLLRVLVPVHLLYLLIVFDDGPLVPFGLIMGVGGTSAVALGWFVALLQCRAERQAFDATLALREQKDDLAAALTRVSHLLDQRNEMVATVAHDLQSPLAGIRALLRTVSNLSATDGGKLQEIARTCADMQDAITRLIDAHAVEAGDGARTTVDLEQLFARVASVAAPAAAEKNIKIICDANLRRARAEPVALDRALGNLLSNAVKFSPAGSVVRMNAQSHGGGVRVSVIDRGPGIPAAESTSLFKKFATLSPRPTDSEPTSGLGLYIVRSLAERMGAVAGFAPNPEGGSVLSRSAGAVGPPCCKTDELSPHELIQRNSLIEGSYDQMRAKLLKTYDMHRPSRMNALPDDLLHRAALDPRWSGLARDLVARLSLGHQRKTSASHQPGQGWFAFNAQ